MTEAIYSHINSLAAYGLIISAILIIRSRKGISGAYSIAGFIMCVFLYLVIDSFIDSWLFWIILIGPFLLPFTFWLTARTLFNDHPLSSNRLGVYLSSTIVIYYGLYILSDVQGLTIITSIAGKAFSIFFIVLAIIEAQVGRRTDLDIQRIRLRKYFTYFIGAVVFLTILSELGLPRDEQELPRLIQRSFILLFNTVFICFNFSIKSNLFDAAKKLTEVIHPEIIDKIKLMMLDNEMYRQEKLTIGKLAEALGEQEYRVRKIINQEMGYRNFIDFINSYRIREAAELLKNPDQVNTTVLEIAYKIGFNSIGPFNRSFKQIIGLTPTDYRKKHLGS